ncbi:GerW family sporulation protein [Acetobacterium sp.]|uniref:GerW family sporulation protein n=1 Tax=Acetobacterium sp. TaxID=1872094 RepID=UPI002F41226B
MEVGNVVRENLEALFGKLEKFLKTETVVGQPIVIGETTIVPIVSITFGCATGAGEGTGNDPKNGSGSGAGSGLSSGAKITPTAVLVIQNNEVTLLPVKDKFGLENLLNKVPDLMEKMQNKPEEMKTEKI